MKNITPECRHTESPQSYIAWHYWADEKRKTHEQVKCPHCDLWAIWKLKENKGDSSIRKCPECNGKGHHPIEPSAICPMCKGKGR